MSVVIKCGVPGATQYLVSLDKGESVWSDYQGAAKRFDDFAHARANIPDVAGSLLVDYRRYLRPVRLRRVCS